MSTEQPGKSSKREGLRLKTGFSLREECTDLWPRMSFILGAEIGGRTVRPDKLPSLRVCEESRKPSVRQYSLCVRCPWLVSLKWYWHDPLLTRHTEDSKKVRHTVSTTFSLLHHHIIISKFNAWVWPVSFYQRYVPSSRLGAKGLSLRIVVPVPVAERGTVCVWLCWTDTSSLSSKTSVSFRCATTLSSSWLSGGTSPSLGSTRQEDLLRLWGNRNTIRGHLWSESDELACLLLQNACFYICRVV